MNESPYKTWQQYGVAGHGFADAEDQDEEGKRKPRFKDCAFQELLK